MTTFEPSKIKNYLFCKSRPIDKGFIHSFDGNAVHSLGYYGFGIYMYLAIFGPKTFDELSKIKKSSCLHLDIESLIKSGWVEAMQKDDI